jgi:hypothetical protein
MGEVLAFIVALVYAEKAIDESLARNAASLSPIELTPGPLGKMPGTVYGGDRSQHYANTT